MGKRGSEISDILNMVVGGGIAIFATLLGSSLLIGLALDRENAELLLIMTGFSFLFCGLGCAVYFYYVWKKRIYRPLYRVSLILAMAGFILAVITFWIYSKS